MTDGSLRTLRRGRIVVGILVAAMLLLLLGRGLVGVYVDALWFGVVGYRDVFWTRLAWVWGTRVVIGVAVAAVVFLNLRYAARTLSGIQIKRRFGNLEISEQLPRTYVLWAISAVSGLLGLWFAASVGSAFGELVLFASRGVVWGVSEPVLGKDASFYVFALPILRSSTTFLLVLAFLVFTVCTAGYAATGSLRWGRGGVVMGNQPRIHLGAVAAVFVL
ncbi:MAG TPA: UPF0182 family protein, partial [Longimicrobiales bacterium]|nr:UPF0182 family protein [Longimicrobiales bacterium]